MVHGPSIPLSNRVSRWIYWELYICTSASLCWLAVLSNNDNKGSKWIKRKSNMEFGMKMRRKWGSKKNLRKE